MPHNDWTAIAVYFGFIIAIGLPAVERAADDAEPAGEGQEKSDFRRMLYAPEIAVDGRDLRL